MTLHWSHLALLVGLILNVATVPAAEPEAVRYCDYPVYPPMSWRDPQGKIHGLAPRAARAVIEGLGLPLETIVLGNWKRCLTDAAEGRVDLVIAYRSPEREQNMVFSQVPLLREEVAIFYNRHKPLRVTQLEDLARYRGGLLFGESYGQDLDRIVANSGNVERVANSQQNFGKLIRGRIDYIAHERHTGKLYLEHLQGAEEIKILPLPVAVDHLYLGVSKHSPLASRMTEIDEQLLLLVQGDQISRWLQESEQAYREAKAGQLP